jgi:3'-phosphoadenosine 5'-phosphosulfate sulfotransferase (PAPS reductase)/FAD synthetase
LSGREKVARLHAKTRGFAAKVETAERIVDGWLSQCSNPTVAFSAGKDSTVCLHLVRARVPDAPALYADDEWQLSETDALLGNTPNLVRIVRRLRHCEWFTAWEDVTGPEGGSKNRWARDHGYDGMAIGLRSDESARRRMQIRARGTAFWNESAALWWVYPVAWWTALDVWAYIYSREVPFNRAYDVLERIGVPMERQRIGPFASDRALGGGAVAILKRGWPDQFNRFAARYPQARAYA